MIISFGIISFFVIALLVVDKLLAAPTYDENTSDHFNGTKFINPDDSGTHHYFEVLKWWFSSNDKGLWHDIRDEVISFPSPKEKVHPEEFHVTFINHATFLIQVDGLNILTDPVWSHRVSPYQWIGPKRMRAPGIDLDDIPPIDVVLISHNHYDHLDIRTVKNLHRKFDPQFIVPLGVEKYLHENGIHKTTHLDWWDTHKLDVGMSISAVPARHFSGRGLFDRNKTLWCGYVLHASLGNIYFAGDTAYGDFFKEITARYGPMHTSFIPIGAYKPRWFMEAIHMSPEEAVKAHLDVQSQRSFAMHHGTFPMADDGMYEPLMELADARKKYDISPQEFTVLEEGEPHEINVRNKAEVA